VRICSLLPAATEIVGALGLTGQLVGRSHECDWPPEVGDLPVVTASRVDTSELTGLEVDAAVRDALTDGRALYAIDEGLVDELGPDLVITQDTCAVCAVSSDEVRLCGIEAEVLSLDARTIAEIEDSVVVLARRLGVPEAGRAVAAEMCGRLTAVREAVEGLERPPVFVAEWLDPPFAAGHWVPETVTLAGGREMLGKSRAPSFRTTWDAVRAADPEVVVLAPCGYGIEETHERALADGVLAELAETPAGRSGAIYAVDANAYFSRPGPRVVDAVGILATLLRLDQPEAFASAVYVARGRDDPVVGSQPLGRRVQSPQ
jgi:iron complex transport system substrate-binding protein